MAITIDKPQTIIGKFFEDDVFVTVPDVTFDDCSFYGKRTSEDILLTCSHRTKLLNCALYGSDNGAHRGIRVDGIGIRIINTKVKNIFNTIDTQAIGAWDGCKDLIVKNCELEASGEVIMFGGSKTSGPDTLPTDIIVEDCVITRKIEWKEQEGVTNKTLIEIKSGKNIKFLNNIGQYSWHDGQIGWAVVLTTRQDPSPWAKIENVEFINNNFSAVARGISIQGTDNYSTDPADGNLKNVLFKGNSFDIDNQWGDGSMGMQIQIVRGSNNLHLIGNKFRGDKLNSFLYFANNLQEPLNNGLIIDGNHAEAGEYGIKGDGVNTLGVEALEKYAPGYVWGVNTINGKEMNPYVIWPKGTL